MSQMELVDEPVDVTAILDEDGQFVPQQLVWRQRRYPVVNVGRQWDEENRRFTLVEVADGTRFELQLDRATLAWRIKKIWWGQIIA